MSAGGSASAADVTLSHTAGSADDSLYADLSGDTLGVTVIARASGALVIQLGVTTLDQELTVEEGGSGSYAIVLSHVSSGDVTVNGQRPHRQHGRDRRARVADLLHVHLERC